MTDSMKTHNMEQRITAIRARLKRLSTEQEKLEQELHELLLIRQRTISSWSPPARTSDQYPPDEKIRIFRSLFRGREDVFPRRFESMKTGKSGYQPVCTNEWRRGICSKPKIKCSECRANFKSIGSLVLITCFFVRQNRFGALIQTFSQKTAKNQISGRFPPLPSTRDVLDILLFTSA